MTAGPEEEMHGILWAWRDRTNRGGGSDFESKDIFDASKRGLRMPLVSIVIPCYRGRRFVGEAIESCLRQTHSDLEVIVVDDASPENDAEIAESYAKADSRVRVLRHERNGGVSRAFNTGFADAKGEYHTRLAQDDSFREDALAIMVAGLEARPDCGLVYCDMQIVDEYGNFITFTRTEEPDRALLPRHRMGVCVLWRREVWDRVGPFDPRFDTSEDYEFFLRIYREYPIEKCRGEAPFFFRYHASQGGIRQEKRQNLTYVMSQAAHHWEMAKRHPLKTEHWRKVVTCKIRILQRWLELRSYERKLGTTSR